MSTLQPVLADGGRTAGSDTVATLLVVAAVAVLIWFRIVRRRTRDGGRPRWLNLLPVGAGLLVLAAVLAPTFVSSAPA